MGYAKEIQECQKHCEKIADQFLVENKVRTDPELVALNKDLMRLYWWLTGAIGISAFAIGFAVGKLIYAI